MFRHRRLTTKCVLQHRLQVLETILYRVTERQSLEEGRGKLWCALMEQDEQREENYCGIETGVRIAGREILSAGLLELWTVVLIFLCQACCYRYRTVEILSFVNRVNQLCTFFSH